MSKIISHRYNIIKIEKKFLKRKILSMNSRYRTQTSTRKQFIRKDTMIYEKKRNDSKIDQSEYFFVSFKL